MNQSTPPLLQQMMSVVYQEHANPDFSIKQLSKKLNLSERHSRRILKNYTGQTFHNCLREIRIKEAAHLLVNSTHNLKLIAALVGYKDRSYFGKDFRLLMRSTPLQFRVNHQHREFIVLGED